MSDFSDNFNRSDGPVGAPWVAEIGAPAVSSNALSFPAANLGGEDLALVDVDEANHDVSVDVVNRAGDYPSIVACARPGASRGYRLAIAAGGTVQIDRYAAFAADTVALEVIPGGIPVMPFRIRLVVSGTSAFVLVEAFVAGNLIADYGDDEPLDGEHAGAWSSHGGSERVDNFHAIGTLRPRVGWQVGTL